MTDWLVEAQKAIANIPLLDGAGTPQRLGGLTNLVFRVGDYCLRIPGKGTEEYINRAHEEEAAREAARAGVSPEVLYFETSSGVMVTRFIDGAVTMTPDGFRDSQGQVRHCSVCTRPTPCSHFASNCLR